MITWIVFVASSIFALANAIECPYCTADGVYTDKATACDNVQKDSICELQYGASDVEDGGSEERPVKCYNGTKGLDADLIDYATQNCPRTCGFCCRTPAFNCEDKPLAKQGPFICTKVTKAQCQDPVLKPYLADECPATCGLCQYGNCVDNPVVNCASQPGICLSMPDFAKDQCRRTCDLCDTAVVNPTSGPSPTLGPSPTDAPVKSTLKPSEEDCKDLFPYPNCHNWNVNANYCTNTQFPYEERKKNCGKTCGFCGSSAGSPSSDSNCIDHSSSCVNPGKMYKKCEFRCAGWAHNNYCSNTWYSFEDRKYACGKTCGFC